ncbi:glycerophosphodiester phosphodiesterase family protein [Paenibacillus peoriae]|uniref:glycerophosphodiester phosphodiesterase family protein n=1 Tax=Paenibacillus peoriae TaxID=59893 RepID=UPI00026C5801|nr:glycerophosphodiester phosphodiesterase family protein [Paenibacillus peoriae]MEC0182723.1 glycerophosphodiester phosphodiesterase family protein [Paenibacillus peoriae]
MSHMNTQKPSFKEIIANFSNPNGSHMIVSHRGHWRRAPENSLDSIRFSYESGIDVVEVDVQKTRDGVLMLMHDERIDRMTNGSGRIDELTFRQIREFRLKEGQGGEGAALTNEVVPTLREAMLLAKDKVMLNLDKCWSLREEVYALLQETDTLQEGLFKSTADADEVKHFLEGKAVRPQYMQMIEESNQHIIAELPRWTEDIKPDAYELIFEHDNSHIISEETLQLLRGKARIWINTMWGHLCGGHDDQLALSGSVLGWDWNFSKGANMIQTDYPDELFEHLHQKR